MPSIKEIRPTSIKIELITRNTLSLLAEISLSNQDGTLKSDEELAHDILHTVGLDHLLPSDQLRFHWEVDRNADGSINIDALYEKCKELEGTVLELKKDNDKLFGALMSVRVIARQNARKLQNKIHESLTASTHGDPELIESMDLKGE